MSQFCYRCGLGAPAEQRGEPPWPRADVLRREGAQDGAPEGGRDRSGLLQEDAHQPAHGIDTARHSVQHRSYEQARIRKDDSYLILIDPVCIHSGVSSNGSLD